MILVLDPVARLRLIGVGIARNVRTGPTRAASGQRQRSNHHKPNESAPHQSELNWVMVRSVNRSSMSLE